MFNSISNYSFSANKFSFTGRKIIKLKLVPEIVVVDSFNRKITDINGDGIPDLSHGKFCKTVIKSVLPKAHVTNYRVAGYKGHTGDENMSSVVANFHKIAEKIKNGGKVDAVNFSFGIVKTFDELSKYLKTNITRQNVNEHVEEIKNWLQTLNKPENKGLVKEFDSNHQGIKDIHKAISSIEEVTSQGVPVYIGAGNSGPESFNLYTLANKSISVKAMNGDKVNSKVLDFSCDNSVSKRGARGIYFPIKVVAPSGKVKGYKISENSKLIIKARELSKRPLVVDKFVGKKLQNVLATEEDYKDLQTFLELGELSEAKEEHLNNIVFKVDKYATVSKKAGEEFTYEWISFLKRHATFVDLNMERLLKVDKEGNIIHGSKCGVVKAKTAIAGTSFSSPRLLAKDIEKKYLKNK